MHGDIDVFVEVQVETCHRTEQVEGCFEAGCIIRVTPKGPFGYWGMEPRNNSYPNCFSNLCKF